MTDVGTPTTPSPHSDGDRSLFSFLVWNRGRSRTMPDRGTKIPPRF